MRSVRRSGDLGHVIQRWLSTLEHAIKASSLASLLLGIGLAVLTVTGGLTVFIIVWALLVGVVR